MFKKILLFTAKAFLLILTLVIFVVVFVFFENNSVVKTKYSIYSDKVPAAFDGYKIALISDHHNSDNINEIIQIVLKINPQLIVMAGDSINMFDEDYNNAVALSEQLANVAPTYFTSGNHELWSGIESDFLRALEAKGVNVLNNRIEKITYKNAGIDLIGCKDIIYSDGNMRYDILNKGLDELYKKVPSKGLFNILVFHKGNYFDTIAKYPYDLVLSGHLHGGQVNLPLIKSRILKQRFFTDAFSKGYYRKDNCQMVISSGLEKNYRYPRIFNPPEVVEVMLKHLE